MNSVSFWTQATQEAVSEALAKIVRFLPNIIGAILVVVVGVVIGVVLKKGIVTLLKLLKVEDFSEKIGLAGVLRKAEIKTTISSVLGDLVKWIVIIVFLLPASEIVGLTKVSELLNKILGYIPNVVVAVIILMLGSLLADFLAALVRGSTALLKVKTVKLLAAITRYSIIVFAVIAALIQLGVAADLWIILFQAVILTIAGSVILAFGLGGKDIAAKAIDEFYNKYLK